MQQVIKTRNSINYIDDAGSIIRIEIPRIVTLIRC